MDIERVRILKTLKAGNKIWREGEIIIKPIPSELINEVRDASRHVEVLGPEVSKGQLDAAVSVKKAQLEAETVNKIAKLEEEHVIEVRRLEERIELLEIENAKLTKRAEASEKNVANLEKKAK